ncbi:hypothetical protein AeMF1_008918 [Aphanomyces euteiches]|nr:hypothetical protein AeMF1_008918 [Aphanomyces euteiches]
MQRHSRRKLWRASQNEISSRKDMLPVDVILKIAFLLPDLKEVLALLDTLRPFIAFGPLEDLYQLSLTHDHSSLWPRLTLDCSMNDTMSITLYESIVKLYSHVLVVDSWYSVDWLKKHLNPMATIATEFPVTIDHLDDWVDLRLSRLNLLIEEGKPETWKMVLPRMRHLRSLRTECFSGNLGDVYAIVAKSSQITELQIKPIGFELYKAEAVHLRYLIEWFLANPFECSNAGS